MDAIAPLIWDIFGQTRAVIYSLAAVSAVFIAAGCITGHRRWTDFFGLAGAVFFASLVRGFAEFLAG